jgi:hypothetical protein
MLHDLVLLYLSELGILLDCDVHHGFLVRYMPYTPPNASSSVPTNVQDVCQTIDHQSTDL